MKKSPKPKAKAAEPERYDTPEALAKFDRESFERGVQLYEEMQEYRREWTAAKERAADLKKQYEAARIAHEEHTAERKKWRGHKPPGVQLTFADIDPTGKSYEYHADAEPGKNPLPFRPDAPNAELWRQYPVSRWQQYGLTASDIKKLSDGKVKGKSKSHPIITVGDLTDFTKGWESDPTRNYNYQDIAGIGDAGADRIRDAELRFWNDWNTKGLDWEFALEMGVPLDANAPAEPAAGKGTPGAAGGDGDKPGQRKRAGGGGAGGKAAAAKKRQPAAGKSAAKKKGKAAEEPADTGGGEPEPADAQTLPFPVGGESPEPETATA